MKTKYTKNFVILILFIFLTTLSCKKEKDKAENYCIINGKIEGIVADTLKLLNFEKNELSKIAVQQDKTFSDTLNLTNGYYFIEIEKHQTLEVYLKNNYNLNISINAKSVNYKGKGANENNYLVEKKRLNNKLNLPLYFNVLGTYKEHDFLKLNDSIFTVKKSLLQVYKQNINEVFWTVESAGIKYEKLNRLSSYPNAREYTSNKAFKTSNNYPNLSLLTIDVDNERLLQSIEYRNYTSQYFRNLTFSKLKKITTTTLLMGK